ncbi:DUF4177 domain-containing protein [Aliishimia ponticola]|uniref:DUF4177 domain-containing protein n=1 Tax=Aliishimia ponticola TaxID=2499833 RepID=A0A4S4NJF3_9RHOB|nr:DUF4177 domain-containing protein [Aliishimia ponticola]THH39035.1 DUF4177 domain-containing protein [Aliishimia ponticola]
MAAYEYKVVPAPTKGVKAKSVKTPEARFALTLQDLMNELGADGWQYQRADTLPSTERSGLTGSTTTWRHVLVFKRQLVEDAEQTSILGEEHLDEAQPPFANDPSDEMEDIAAEAAPVPLRPVPPLRAVDDPEPTEKSDV